MNHVCDVIMPSANWLDTHIMRDSRCYSTVRQMRISPAYVLANTGVSHTWIDHLVNVQLWPSGIFMTLMMSYILVGILFFKLEDVLIFRLFIDRRNSTSFLKYSFQRKLCRMKRNFTLLPLTEQDVWLQMTFCWRNRRVGIHSLEASLNRLKYFFVCDLWRCAQH